MREREREKETKERLLIVFGTFYTIVNTVQVCEKLIFLIISFLYSVSFDYII